MVVSSLSQKIYEVFDLRAPLVRQSTDFCEKIFSGLAVGCHVYKDTSDLAICRHGCELARKLGVAQGDLSKMETGKRSIGKEMAHRLAGVFDTDYRVFL